MKPGKELTTAPSAASSPGALPEGTPGQPYLPGYGAGSSAPVPVYNPGNSDSQTVPSYQSAPPPAQTHAPAAGNTRLRDYIPQAALRVPRYADSMQPVRQVAANGEPQNMFLMPAVFMQQTSPAAAPQTQAAQSQTQQPAPPPAQILKPGPLTAQPNATSPSPAPAASQEVYGPYVPYHPPPATAVQLGTTPPVHTPTQPEVTDVLPTAHYVPNAKSRSTTSSHSEVNAAAAAEARRRKSTPPRNAERTGESKPPAEDYNTTPTEGVQYNPAAAAQAGVQVAKPGTQGVPQNNPSATTNGNIPQGGSGSSYGQQYPQPNTSPYIAPRVTATRGRSRAKTHVAAAVTPAPAAPAPQPAYAGAQLPGCRPVPRLSTVSRHWPRLPTRHTAQRRRPDVQAAAPLARRLRSPKNLPPPTPLTPREQTERDLANA